MASGDLITRDYTNFRGVDFVNKEVSPYRSPDSLNMWKNYSSTQGRGIETRPDITSFLNVDGNVYGIFKFTINNVDHLIIHCGVKLIDYNESTHVQNVIKQNGMNPRRSQSFIYNNILYIKDGINYLEYDGATLKEVEGYIPTTTIGKAPTGEGTTYEDVNLLTPIRKNTFVGDGTSTVYQLDARGIDNEYVPQVKVNGVTKTVIIDFSVDYTNGKITFNIAPPEPDTVGQDNVEIQFSKTISGYRNRINKCTLLEVFDNRVFFSGNQDYPNTLFHSNLMNPRYVSDNDFYTEGLDTSMVKSMVAGNNALWVFKEPSQANTTIFYHNPSIDSNTGKVYPSSHSSISLGCVSTGINFGDDICFFSPRGLEGISSDVTTEQVVKHRSSLVDAKLVSESNYNNLVVTEYDGYLMVFIDKKVYLADSRGKWTNNDHLEYEWFYWEIPYKVISATVMNEVLYIGSENAIYKLVPNTSLSTINSYWTTPQDEFKYPQMQKTTNKRGCVVDMEGSSITMDVKIDNGQFATIKTYTNTKGYVVPRIKKKKWKSIQLKFKSTVPFGLYECTLESFIGAYVKR